MADPQPSSTSLTRSHSLPEDNGKQASTPATNTRAWKRIDGLNPQENWKRIKRFAYRRRGSSSITKGKGKKASIDDNDTIGVSLLRRLEYNQIPVTLLAMKVQQDEKGLPRIPVLFSILKVQVSQDHISPGDGGSSSKKKTSSASSRHQQLCLEVSYGATQWTLHRQFWDFVKLHYSYCGYDLARARRPTNLPAFPSIVLHHHRHRRRQRQRNKPTSGIPSTEQDRPIPGQQQQQSRTVNRSGSSLASNDRFSLGCIEDPDIRQTMEYDSSGEPSPTSLQETNHQQHQQQQQNQDRTCTDTKQQQQYDNLLEEYITQLIKATLHTGNINRLCKFLEISTLGIHLRATQPQGYHGKEGYMVIVARTDHGPKHSRWKFGSSCFGGGDGGSRKTSSACHPPACHGKNNPKWFIIRDNYMVCVNHPHDTHCYDVVLFEPGIQIERGHPQTSDSKVNALKVTIKTAAKLSLGHSTLRIKTSAGEMYLRAKNVRQAIQFEQSLLRACRQSTWCLKSQRFNSFAPVRQDCPTTWFVDGNDYFYQVSVALENARNYIYIHDWWLSPELYLRRLPSENEKWRLDTVLKRKADQGVKIYVIVYKEVAMAVPLFSHYTKKYLLSLSSNIYVQRHPSRALDILSNQGTLFFAHHEKICLIDGVVAFIGGLDLCYGRYDNYQHKVTDDPATTDQQTWIGKDYANPRIEDYHALDKPFEDNMDRSALPRMPWHDISVRLGGAAAHDVEHHFVQRWNYLRRQKSTAPKRPTPMLLPSGPRQLDEDDPRIGSKHTSLHTQVQILRSVSAWSTGVDQPEHSIMNAYVELIESSRHFVYIENQFFITSTQYGATVIENKIGDALYNRILRAHQNKENWYCVIVMPLVPEFPGSWDLPSGTTIRLIMYLQHLSIGRGSDSLLGKLHAAGVTNTSHYIKFYSLRNWGELNGSFVTEQVYVHAKTMIVDDRTVLIGSANINERSMLGTRDSEICACVEDMDLVDSLLGGQPTKVGRFAHSLRLRLMSEHLGLPMDEGYNDVDTLLDAAAAAAAAARPNMETTGKRKDKIRRPHASPSIMAHAPSCHPSSRQQQEETLGQPTDQQLKHTTFTTSTSTSESEKGNHHHHHHHSTLAFEEGLDGAMDDNTVRTTLGQEYTMSEETMALYKDWATWDTDTDNNGDGQSLVPLPLLLTVVSPNGDDDDNDDEKEDQTNTSAKSPAHTTLTTTMTKRMDSADPQETDTSLQAADTSHLFASLCDPLDKANQVLWDTFARRNTDLFRRCFMVLPDNNVRSWTAFEHYEKLARQVLGRTTDGVTKHLAQATTHPTPTCFMLPFVPTLLDQVRGHLVIWPVHFMEDEGDDFVFAMDKIVPLEIFD